MSNINRVLASIQNQGIRLELSTTDLSYIVALAEKSKSDVLPSLDEDTLIDIYRQVLDITEPGAEKPGQRATNAIQRLSEQRLLRRIDADGLVRAGDFNLSQLARSIAEFYRGEEALTRDSLSLLTKILVNTLVDIKADAEAAPDDEGWRMGVIEPLRIAVADLIRGIERRTQGLEQQQAEIQEEIQSLLSTDWAASIEKCENLLAQTLETLKELREVLLRDAVHMQGTLDEIQGLAEGQGQDEAVRIVVEVTRQLDRLMHWSEARQRAWSHYYERVHQFLRDVVRLDPNRAISRRLQDQLIQWSDHPHYLRFHRDERIRLLRDPEVRIERIPIRRERQALDTRLEEVAPDTRDQELQARVQSLLDDGKGSLTQILEEILPEIASADRYRIVGHVAQYISQLAQIKREIQRPWLSLKDGLEVEEWGLRIKESPDE